MKEILVVIDMQNDFIDGALGSAEAQKILPDVISYVKGYNGEICYTLDTHGEDYMSTSEGRHLPVPHCIKGTCGHNLPDKLKAVLKEKNAREFLKPTFGSTALAEYIKSAKPDRVTLIGVCTDICVVSNALLIKANLPEAEIEVIPRLCAGVTPELHNAAIRTMASCQIEIKGE